MQQRVYDALRNNENRILSTLSYICTISDISCYVFGANTDEPPYAHALKLAPGDHAPNCFGRDAQAVPASATVIKGAIDDGAGRTASAEPGEQCDAGPEGGAGPLGSFKSNVSAAQKGIVARGLRSQPASAPTPAADLRLGNFGMVLPMPSCNSARKSSPIPEPTKQNQKIMVPLKHRRAPG